MAIQVDLTSGQAREIRPLLDGMETGGCLIAQVYPEHGLEHIRVGVLSQAELALFCEILARRKPTPGGETT